MDLFFQKLEALETYSPVKLQLNLNCNSVFIELAKWIYSKSRWSSNLLKEFVLSKFTSNSFVTLL